MRVPIRIIGIATSAFWIFLIIFSASEIYSMKDLRVNIGQPQASTTGDHELLLSFPVSVVNTGLYDVASFNVSIGILDTEGSTVARGTMFMPVIRHGQVINITQDVKLNLTDLFQTHQSLLCNDTEFIANKTVTMLVTEFIPVEASSNSSVPWGAPLYGLTLGTPQFAAYNATHSYVTLPLSFENHAFFDVAGMVRLLAYSNTNVAIGQNQTYIQVPQHSPYHGDLEVYVPLQAGPVVRLEVSFVTTFVNYVLEVTALGG
jgi:hypothetical protein